MDPAFLRRVAQAITRGVRRYFAAGVDIPRRATIDGTAAAGAAAP
jgi:hypothetical protein